jgi:hypothetical protein
MPVPPCFESLVMAHHPRSSWLQLDTCTCSKSRSDCSAAAETRHSLAHTPIHINQDRQQLGTQLYEITAVRERQPEAGRGGTERNGEQDRIDAREGKDI